MRDADGKDDPSSAGRAGLPRRKSTDDGTSLRFLLFLSFFTLLIIPPFIFLPLPDSYNYDDYDPIPARKSSFLNIYALPYLIPYSTVEALPERMIGDAPLADRHSTTDTAKSPSSLFSPSASFINPFSPIAPGKRLSQDPPGKHPL